MAPQPFVPLANGAQVEVICTLLGQVVESRLWFITRFDPVDPTLLLALAEGVSAWYRSQVLPVLSDELQVISVRATDWTADPAPSSAVDNTIESGGVAGGSHSANVAVRVTFKGDNTQTFPNNSNFVPGIPLSAVDGNYYNSTIRDALFEAYVALIDLTFHFEATHNWRWVITSRVADRVYRVEQAYARTDFIYLSSPVISPRRHRLP